MKIPYCIAIIFSCIIFSCKEPKQSTSAPSPAPQTKSKSAATSTAPVSISIAGSVDESVEPDAAGVTKLTNTNTTPVMAFIVSFYSIGAGIDRGQPEKLIAYVEAYGNKINTKVEYVETHWGREGETDYCFPLAGLSESAISDFKNGAKEALKSAEHVHFLENQACRSGR